MKREPDVATPEQRIEENSRVEHRMRTRDEEQCCYCKRWGTKREVEFHNCDGNPYRLCADGVWRMKDSGS